MSARLERLRRGLKDVDRALVPLLSERMALADRVAGEKRRTGAPLRCLPRERAGREQAAGGAGPWAPAVREVLACLARTSLDVQARRCGGRPARRRRVKVGAVTVGGPVPVLVLRSAGRRRLRGPCILLDAPGRASAATVEDPRALPRGGALLAVPPWHMRNRALLEALAAQPRPVLLNRAPDASLEELLEAAGRLESGGLRDILLGVGATAAGVLDLLAVPVLRSWAPYPVLVEPGPAAGLGVWVPALARAALAAGADGLILEEGSGLRALAPAAARRVVRGLGHRW